jgi:hypothetical protein
MAVEVEAEVVVEWRKNEQLKVLTKAQMMTLLKDLLALLEPA